MNNSKDERRGESVVKWWQKLRAELWKLKFGISKWEKKSFHSLLTSSTGHQGPDEAFLQADDSIGEEESLPNDKVCSVSFILRCVCLPVSTDITHVCAGNSGWRRLDADLYCPWPRGQVWLQRQSRCLSCCWSHDVCCVFLCHCLTNAKHSCWCKEKHVLLLCCGSLSSLYPTHTLRVGWIRKCLSPYPTLNLTLR